MDYNTYKKMPPIMIIFSHWLWIWGIMFFLKFTNLSPLPSLIIAIFLVIIFAFVLNIFKTVKFKLFVSTAEIFILLLVIYTRHSINIHDIIANIALFVIYNIFLLMMGTNIYEIYFIFMPRNAKENVKDYFNYVLKKSQPTIFVILFLFLLKFFIKQKK